MKMISTRILFQRPLSIFSGKGMMLVKPDVVGEYREGVYSLEFRKRVEKQRVFIKDGSITLHLSALHASSLLLQGMSPEFSAELKSEKGLFQLQVNRLDDKINLAVKGVDTEELVIEASQAEWKLLLVLIEASIPSIYGWGSFVSRY